MVKSGLARQQLQPVLEHRRAQVLTSVRASAAEKAMAELSRSSQMSDESESWKSIIASAD